MKPNIEDTDIIIRRVSNGWIVFSGSEFVEEHFITTVYEESETELGVHHALINLFREHFDGYTQAKKRGGIKLEIQEKGYAFEEDEMGGNPVHWKWRTDALLDEADRSEEAVCDVCGRVVDEYEPVSCDNLAGVVMCAGAMKDSCKTPLPIRGR